MYETPNLSNPALEKARVFAHAVHSSMGQRRKYDDLPYIMHPLNVCAILQNLPFSSGITVDQQISAILHDTVEDSRVFNPDSKTTRIMREGITLDLIEEEFGAETRRIVSGLTDVSMPWDGNRDFRKKIDLEHTRQQAPDVHTVKLADLISNAPSIIEHDIGFARKWMREKAALLDVLSDGDPILFMRAMEIMSDYIGRNHA